MNDATKQQDPNTEVDPKDLDLVDDHLEDEHTDDAALWAEIDQAEGGSTDDDTQPPGDDAGGEGDDEQAAVDAGASDDGAATRDHGSDDAPGDDGQSDASASDKATPPQAKDLWANATPEQKAAFEAAEARAKKLEQAERSNRGRLSALQRQINELTRAAPKAADKGQDGEATTDILNDPDLKAAAEEYPEVAGPFIKVLGAMQEQLNRANKELSAIGNDRRQAAVNEQVQLLAEAHPDWQEIRDGDAGYDEWLNKQPPGIQALQESPFAADAITLLNLYKATKGGGSTQTAPANGGQGAPNNRLSGKRQAQLDGAASTRSKGPGVASGIPEDADEETIWNMLDEKERREARA